MPETMKTPAELRAELEEHEAILAERVQRRTVLLRETIEAIRGGANPNGQRAKLLEEDAEIDIRRGAIEAIEAELPEAEAAALLDFQLGAVERMKETKAKASPHVTEMVRLAVAMVEQVDGLRSYVRNYSTAYAQAGGGKAPNGHTALTDLVRGTLDDEGTRMFTNTVLPAVDGMRVLVKLAGTEGED